MDEKGQVAELRRIEPPEVSSWGWVAGGLLPVLS